MTVITRFAPSPTGFLHIGSARTALFNWLFARHHQGKYYLRIEDTDQERSTEEAIHTIISSLRWLDLSWDGAIVYQSTRRQRHTEVAMRLLEQGSAYYCQCSPERLQHMREDAREHGRPMGYDRSCRDKGYTSGALRLKVQSDGICAFKDAVQGMMTIKAHTLDDMVLMRSDGTPTYMLSVVVDDHDMGITHIIRGDDHLSNTPRQIQIYNALGWDIPHCAHIPLIHGSDGAKLSKRHGAIGADAYKAMGYLPDAMFTYLLRLGWSHGDEELIRREQAIQHFSLGAVGKSPARFDMKKLSHINGVYMRERDNDTLLNELKPYLPASLSAHELTRIHKGLTGLKKRATTLVELAESARLYYKAPATYTEKAANTLASFPELPLLVQKCESMSVWNETELENLCRTYAEQSGCKLINVAQPLRAALTGTTISPSVFEIMSILGKEETLHRLHTAQNSLNANT